VKSVAGVIRLKNTYFHRKGKDDADGFCENVRLTSFPENQTRNVPLNYLHFDILHLVQRYIGKTQDDVMLHQSTVGYLIVSLNLLCIIQI